MKIKKILTGACASVVSALMLFTSNSFAADPPINIDGANCVFYYDEDVNLYYWYENGTRQALANDPKNVFFKEDPTNPRGREIYDSATDAWYWLDVIRNGAKATSKEVFIPYIYQNEASFRNDESKLNIEASACDNMNKSSGFGEYLKKCIKEERGKWVRYDANGKMIKGWYTEDGSIKASQKGNTYYYDKLTGLMAKGDITIEGVSYHFNETTGVLEGNQGGAVNFDTGYTVDPSSIKEIKEAPGLYAIESDVQLSGSGNGYHAKLVISNGASATVSFGIQYDVNSGKDFARGKCALMIEDATPSAQYYPFPKEAEGGIIVGNQTGAAHLMLSVNGNSGDYFCFYNGQFVYQGHNSGLVVTDTNNVQIKSEGVADDGSQVVARFRNTKVKYRYYNQYRIATKGTGRLVYHHVYDGCSFSAGSDVGNGGQDPWGLGRSDVYKAAIITGTNASQDWDVPNGVQAYIHYIEGYASNECLQWEKKAFDFDGNELTIE